MRTMKISSTSCDTCVEPIDNGIAIVSEALNLSVKQSAKHSPKNAIIREFCSNKGSEKTKQRKPKCARCFYHKPRGKVLVKSHKRKCPFRECICHYCQLLFKRQELAAKTISEWRKLKEDLENPLFNGYPSVKEDSGHQSPFDETSSPGDSGNGEVISSKKKQSIGSGTKVKHGAENLLNQLREKLSFEEISHVLATFVLRRYKSKDSQTSVINDILKLSANKSKTRIKTNSMTEKTTNNSQVFESSKTMSTSPTNSLKIRFDSQETSVSSSIPLISPPRWNYQDSSLIHTPHYSYPISFQMPLNMECLPFTSNQTPGLSPYPSFMAYPQPFYNL